MKSSPTSDEEEERLPDIPGLKKKYTKLDSKQGCLIDLGWKSKKYKASSNLNI